MGFPSLSRRNVLRLVGATAAAIAAGVAVGPDRYRNIALAQDSEITFWSTGLYHLDDPNDKTKAPEEFYINQAVQRFQDAHAGVKVNITSVPGGMDMFTQYRTASIAKNGPDMMTLWSGTYLLQFKDDFLEDLGPHFSQEERDRIIGWETVTADFTADNPVIWGVPCVSDGCGCLFYNKDMLSKAGVDFESAMPKTADEFITALQKIKDTGVTPLTLDSTGMVWQVLAYWMSQSIGGAAAVNQLVTGEKKFTDPVLVAAADSWKKLYDFTVTGAETMDGDLQTQTFIQGQAAIMNGLAGSIKPATDALGDNLGMVKLPNVSTSAPIQNGGIGGPGVGFIVSNYSEAKDQTIEFVKFLMSKDEQTARVEAGDGGLLNVTDVDTKSVYPNPLTYTQQEWANEPSTIFWNDNIYPAELTTEMLAQAQLAWTGQLTGEEFMQKVDAKRDELLAG